MGTILIATALVCALVLILLILWVTRAPKSRPLPDGWTDLGYVSEDGVTFVGHDMYGAPLYLHQVDERGTE